MKELVLRTARLWRRPAGSTRLKPYFPGAHGPDPPNWCWTVVGPDGDASVSAPTPLARGFYCPKKPLTVRFDRAANAKRPVMADADVIRLPGDVVVVENCVPRPAD